MMHDSRAPSVHERHVFVYGTLRAGGSNDITCFSPPPLRIGDTDIAGTLYDLGAYPGAVLGGEGRVRGEVYRIDAALERQLDRLEEVEPDDSGEYAKREVTVRMGDSHLNCLVYEIHPRRVVGRQAIASGDWFRR